MGKENTHPLSAWNYACLDSTACSLPSIGLGIEGEEDIAHNVISMFVFVMFCELSSQALATSSASLSIYLFNRVASVEFRSAKSIADYQVFLWSCIND